jgi:Fumarylacetoacetate (FAA) hydrolase family
LTGTPAGVGAFRSPPRFLVAGDEVEVEVEGIGVLANPVTGPLGCALGPQPEPDGTVVERTG